MRGGRRVRILNDGYWRLETGYSFMYEWCRAGRGRAVFGVWEEVESWGVDGGMRMMGQLSWEMGDGEGGSWRIEG